MNLRHQNNILTHHDRKDKEERKELSDSEPEEEGQMEEVESSASEDEQMDEEERTRQKNLRARLAAMNWGSDDEEEEEDEQGEGVAKGGEVVEESPCEEEGEGEGEVEVEVEVEMEEEEGDEGESGSMEASVGEDEESELDENERNKSAQPQQEDEKDDAKTENSAQEIGGVEEPQQPQQQPPQPQIQPSSPHQEKEQKSAEALQPTTTQAGTPPAVDRKDAGGTNGEVGNNGVGLIPIPPRPKMPPRKKVEAGGAAEEKRQEKEKTPTEPQESLKAKAPAIRRPSVTKRWMRTQHKKSLTASEGSKPVVKPKPKPATTTSLTPQPSTTGKAPKKPAKKVTKTMNPLQVPRLQISSSAGPSVENSRMRSSTNWSSPRYSAAFDLFASSPKKVIFSPIHGKTDS